MSLVAHKALNSKFDKISGGEFWDQCLNFENQ